MNEKLRQRVITIEEHQQTVRQEMTEYGIDTGPGFTHELDQAQAEVLKWLEDYGVDTTDVVQMETVLATLETVGVACYDFCVRNPGAPKEFGVISGMGAVLTASYERAKTLGML